MESFVKQGINVHTNARATASLALSKAHTGGHKCRGKGKRVAQAFPIPSSPKANLARLAQAYRLAITLSKSAPAAISLQRYKNTSDNWVKAGESHRAVDRQKPTASRQPPKAKSQKPTASYKGEKNYGFPISTLALRGEDLPLHGVPNKFLCCCVG